MKNANNVRVGIIGAGYMAGEHLKAFCACSEVNLVGIHSRNSDRASSLAASYSGLKVASSIEELYKKTNPDLVVIAVPELACKSVCEEAFKYPWKLLIEKPVGHTLNEAYAIEHIATKTNAEAYVALNRRFYSSTLQLQEALNSESHRVVTILDQEDPARALAAGRPEAVVDNWMFANSIHLIDYFAQLCRGEHISTQILAPWKKDKSEPVIAYLEFSSGDNGIYQACWNAPGPWSVAVSTKELRAELRPIEQLSLQKTGSRNAVLQATDPKDHEFKPGLWRQAQEAIKAANGYSTELPTISEANKSMKLVASIYGMS